MFRKLIITLIIICLIPESLVFTYEYKYVREYNNNVAVVVNEESKCGLVNKEMNEVVPCVYDEIYNYGFACAIEKDSKWGIIDLNNNEILPCIYDDMAVLDRNENGYILVVKNGKVGSILLNNLDVYEEKIMIDCKEVIECKYDF